MKNLLIALLALDGADESDECTAVRRTFQCCDCTRPFNQYDEIWKGVTVQILVIVNRDRVSGTLRLVLSSRCSTVKCRIRLATSELIDFGLMIYPYADDGGSDRGVTGSVRLSVELT